MSEKQMNAEQKAVAALGQLGAEVVWLGTSGVDSVYFTRVRIADADLKHLKGLDQSHKAETQSFADYRRWAETYSESDRSCPVASRRYEYHRCRSGTLDESQKPGIS